MRCAAGLIFPLVFLLAGCDDSAEDCSTVAGPCEIVSCAPEVEDGEHVETCSRIDFHSNPPTSGPHYPVWANYQRYSVPVPRGLYLHSMEHGGVVLAYNCGLYYGDCQALVDSLGAVRDSYGQDDDCDPTTKNRILVLPDPDLDVAFAAAAWGHSLRGKCFDGGLVDAFIGEHYANGPEDTCAQGIDPSSGIPPDCGR